jgi:DNA-binding NarL/FixJ family response regulator
MLGHGGLAVAGCFSTASAAAGWFAPGAVDVAILDLDLGPGPTGADLAVKLRRTQPNLGIVLLTVCSDPRLVGVSQGELPLGTHYVLKDSLHDGEVLCDAARSAAASMAADVPAGSTYAVPRTDFGDAQMAVLRLIAQGYSNQEIARRRSVTVEAVERAITRLNRQLGLAAETDRSSRVMLANVYWAMAGGSDRSSALSADREET